MNQPDEWNSGFFFAVLLLKRVAVPVKRGVEIFVFGITCYEVVEFFGCSLPVLRFDRVTAFAEDLHRRGVASALHKAVELGDVLIVTVSALSADCEDYYHCGDSQQCETGSDLGAISN